MNRLRIGINGFGRIGRALFRLNHLHQFFDVAVINERNPDLANIAYQLRYDSIYGAFPSAIELRANNVLRAGDANIAVYHTSHPAEVPWLQHGVDILIDASGASTHPRQMLEAHDLPEKVVFTHAVYDLPQVQTRIFGVNHDASGDGRLFSSSICDAVAAAPILALLDAQFGIASGALTTLHPWLGMQHLQDGAAIATNLPDEHESHFALGRSAINNLIPKSTTAMHAADLVLPGMAKKISSFSYRVPTNVVSSAVLNLELHESVTRETVQHFFHRAEHQQNWRILQNRFEPCVSIDYCGNEYSATIDQRWTHVQNKRNLRLVYWYDNEWGYAARVLDLARQLEKINKHACV